MHISVFAEMMILFLPAIPVYSSAGRPLFPALADYNNLKNTLLATAPSFSASIGLFLSLILLALGVTMLQ